MKHLALLSVSLLLILFLSLVFFGIGSADHHELATTEANNISTAEASDVSTASKTDSITQAKAHQLLEGREFLFEKNLGQIKDTDGHTRSDIMFTARSGNLKLYLGDHHISYVFSRSIEDTESSEDHSLDHRHNHPKPGRLEMYRMDMEFLGANAEIVVRGEDRAIEQRNFFSGAKEIKDVPTFRRVVYQNVYDHIDLVLKSAGEWMKYEFVVRPGGKPSDIQFRYTGAEDVALQPHGSLSIKNPFALLEEEAPTSWTESATGDRSPVESRFRVDGKEVGFGIDDYNKEETLIIDPDVVWATLYGGTGIDDVYEDGGCMAIISEAGKDYVVVGGNSLSTDFPVSTGPFQEVNNGRYDVVLAKLSAVNGYPIWSTYLGGAEEDWIHGVVVDDTDDAIYIAGHTDNPGTATEFPVSGRYAYQKTRNGTLRDRDAFLLKLDADGAMQWGTFVSNSRSDDFYGLSLSPDGDVIVTGFSQDPGEGDPFVIVTDASRYSGNVDIPLMKFDKDDGSREWGTLLGGNSEEMGYAVEATSDAIFLTGYTMSRDLIRPNPLDTWKNLVYQPTNTNIGKSAFVARYDNPTGAPGNNDPVREWVSYFRSHSGSTSNTVGVNLTVDEDGDVLITGYTNAPDLPTKNWFESNSGGFTDAFIAKFVGDINTIPNGRRWEHLVWSSYLGGDGNDEARDVTSDDDGTIWIAGRSSSSNLPIPTNPPTSIPQVSNAGGLDAFLAQFEYDQRTKALKLLWLTYYGGCGEDEASTILPHNDALYASGFSWSNDFPTTQGAFQEKLNGTNGDLFVLKLGTKPRGWRTYLGGTSKDYGFDITTDHEGHVIVVGCTCSEDFPTTVGVYQEDYVGIYPQNDAFVAKFTPDGKQVVASTQYGGVKEDQGRGVDVDAEGNIFMVGVTNSDDIGFTARQSPSTSGYKAGYDAFVVEFTPDLSTRRWARYYGTNGTDRGHDISVNDDGSLVIVGETAPIDDDDNDNDTIEIPQDASGNPIGHDDDHNGNGDAFIAKFGPAWAVPQTPDFKHTLIWASYYGGSALDVASGVDMSDDGTVAVAGWTESLNCDVSTGALQTTHGGGGDDAFAVVFEKTASGDDIGQRRWGTLLGGSKEEVGYVRSIPFAPDIAFDSNGDVVICGTTSSTDFPVSAGSFQPTHGGGFNSDAFDMFLTKIRGSDGAAAMWSTYFGGSSVELCGSVALDRADNIYLAGMGIYLSSDFPDVPLFIEDGYPDPPGPLDYPYPEADALVLAFNSSGFPFWGTLRGGAAFDAAAAITTDVAGDVAVCGVTSSNDFPTTPGAFDQSLNDTTGDAFVLREYPAREKTVSTYYGGVGEEFGNDVALDVGGNIVITGYVAGGALPKTTGRPTPQAADAYVALFSPTGQLRWTSYFGGSGDDRAYSIAVDDHNDIVICGLTTSTDLPGNPGTYAGGATDAFLAKLDGCGALTWAKYWGGSGEDVAHAVAIARNYMPPSSGAVREDIVITGGTNSPDFPVFTSAGGNFINQVRVNGALVMAGSALNQGNPSGASDAFVARFSPTRFNRWSLYYGGSQHDRAHGITTTLVKVGEPQPDPQRQPTQEIIAITGETRSGNQIMVAMDRLSIPLNGNSFSTQLTGETDAFIAVISDRNGAAPNLDYATYYGGDLFDEGADIAFDNNGNLVVTGGTNSSNFPTTQATAFQPLFASASNEQDAFVLKFLRGPTLITWNLFWSTYYGGADVDFGKAITTDRNDDVIVAGYTASADFPVTTPPNEPLQNLYRGGLADAFVFKLDGSLNPAPPSGFPIWSGYLGGRGWEVVGEGYLANEGGGVVADTSGNVYVTGSTNSPDLPVSAGGFSRSIFGLDDAFLIKLDPDGRTLLKPVQGSSNPVVDESILPYTGTLMPNYRLSEPKATIHSVSADQALLRVDLPADALVAISLYSMEGRRLPTPAIREEQRAGTHLFAIPVGDLSSGTYIVHLQAANQSVAVPLMIRR